MSGTNEQSAICQNNDIKDAVNDKHNDVINSVQKKVTESSATNYKRHPQTSALLKAAYEGDMDRVRTFLNDGVPVDACNSAGLRALHFVAKSGQIEVANELIKKGASVNLVSLKGHTPLHVACLLGQREIVKLLLREHADVNAQSKCHDDNFTPLYMASQIGHQEIVTLLLAHGADPTIATKNGSTPKDVANQQGYRTVAEILNEYEKRLHDPSITSSTSTFDLIGDDLLNNHGSRDFYSPDGLSETNGHIGSHRSSSMARLLMRSRPPAVLGPDVIRSPGNYPSPVRPFTPSKTTSFYQQTQN